MFGAHYGVRYNSWSHWWSRNAYGRGQLFAWGGVGTKPILYRAAMRLFSVKTHRGRRYFSRIIISARGHKTLRLSYYQYWHQ